MRQIGKKRVGFTMLLGYFNQRRNKKTTEFLKYFFKLKVYP